MKVHEISGTEFLIAFGKDEDLFELLGSWLGERGITGARLQGIGAFRRCTLGYFQREKRDYDRIEIDEQVELTALLGNTGRDAAGETKIHLHATVSRVDGSAIGGHLLQATVWPTVELFVEVLAIPLIRELDEETNLPLLI